MKLSVPFWLILCVPFVASGCATGERIAGQPRAGSAIPRDIRSAAVTPSGEAADREWVRASQAALRSGLAAPAAFHERLRFPRNAPYAAAYRFEMLRGQTLHVRITDLEGDGALLADVFEMITSDMFRHVHGPSDGAVSGNGTGEVVYTATWSGPHVLRLQPRRDRGGSYDVAVLGEAPLFFPVAGTDINAVGSVFGDPRDGGSRGHEGVDIFAPRGTAVLAAAAGYVTAVQNTPAGGRVIWIEDAARELTYYYAHLDDQYVRRGQYVVAGEVIGTVGNSGNARSTRPHLHFGVYRPGTVAIDPAPLLAHGSPVADRPVNDSALGRWTQVRANGVRLRRAPSLAGAIVAELRAGTPLLVLGATVDWHRVQLEDGTSGFIAAEYTSSAAAGSR
jgi:peptidoglycan LD-endopeptidase LytH